MALFTVISLIIGMFGAFNAIASAVRSHHEAELKKLVEFASQNASKIANGKGATTERAKRNQTECQTAYNRWRFYLVAPTYVFAAVMTGIIVYVEASDWTGTDGQASLIPATAYLWVKLGIGIYAIGMIWCGSRLWFTSRKVRICEKAISDSVEDFFAGQNPTDAIKAA